MPSSNPLIAGAPIFVANQAPAQTGPYDPGGGSGVNPYESVGMVNDTNAAGSQEAVALHVGVIIVLALVGVYVFKGLGFKFVAAAGVGG